MKKKKWFVLVVGLLAVLVIAVFGRKVSGNMADQAIENSDLTEEKVQEAEQKTEKAEDGDQKMEEEATGNGTAVENRETAEEKAEAVDLKMNEVQASDRYRNMSLKERRELASDILLQLEQDGYIIGLSYDEDSCTYSFEYADGTLGGWRIESFASQDGSMPVN